MASTAKKASKPESSSIWSGFRLTKAAASSTSSASQSPPGPVVTTHQHQNHLHGDDWHYQQQQQQQPLQHASSSLGLSDADSPLADSPLSTHSLARSHWSSSSLAMGSNAVGVGVGVSSSNLYLSAGGVPIAPEVQHVYRDEDAPNETPEQRYYRLWQMSNARTTEFAKENHALQQKHDHMDRQLAATLDRLYLLQKDMEILGEKLIDEIEKRAELQHSKDVVQVELETLTQKLFEEANGMVADETRARVMLERSKKELETKLDETTAKLASESHRLRDLMKKIDEHLGPGIFSFNQKGQVEVNTEALALFRKVLATDAIAASVIVGAGDAAAISGAAAHALSSSSTNHRRRSANQQHSTANAIRQTSSDASSSSAATDGSSNGIYGENYDGVDTPDVDRSVETFPARTTSEEEMFEAPVDMVVMSEFEEFITQAPKMKNNNSSNNKNIYSMPFMKHAIEEDVEPCLRFGPGSKVSSRKLMDAIMNNTCFIEAAPRTNTPTPTNSNPNLNGSPSLSSTLALNASPSLSGSQTLTHSSPSLSSSAVLTSASTGSHSSSSSSSSTALSGATSGVTANTNISASAGGSLPATQSGRVSPGPISSSIFSSLGIGSAATSPVSAHDDGAGGNGEDSACCVLCGRVRNCAFRMRLSPADNWLSVDQFCRDRVVAVCDFFSFTRHIQQGLLASKPSRKLFAECFGLKRQMFAARVGCSHYAPIRLSGSRRPSVGTHRKTPSRGSNLDVHAITTDEESARGSPSAATVGRGRAQTLDYDRINTVVTPPSNERRQ